MQKITQKSVIQGDLIKISKVEESFDITKCRRYFTRKDYLP